MKTNLLSLLLLTILFAFILHVCSASNFNKRSRQQQQQEFDDDEFSEFDNLDEEAAKKNKKVGGESKASSSQHQQPNANSKINANKDGFSTFDVKDEDGGETIEDEEFDEKRPPVAPASKPPSSQQDVKQKPAANTFGSSQDMDLDMEEFEHFVDEEEFEGFEAVSGGPSKSSKDTKADKSSSGNNNKDMPNLKIANVPMHLMSNGNWQNYIWEIVMLIVIGIYFTNFIYGKTKNYRLVTSWYNAHRELLERNFSVVGDDGNSAELPNKQAESSPNEIGTLIKDSENSYGLWCTGRQMCDGMLVQLKLIKRQDLINGVIMQMIKPQSDQIIISVEFTALDDIDTFVFCLNNKKLTQQLFNDYQDISSYCVEKKALPSSASNGASSFSGDYKYADLLNSSVASRYTMLNEIGEVPNCVLDSRVCAFLNKYPEMIEYLLISDQYVGYKVGASDEQAAGSTTPTTEASANGSPSASTGLNKSRPILILCLNIPGKGTSTTSEDMEKMQPAFQLAMYLIEKVPRIRLSKEAKVKAIKKRKEVAEQYMKLTHKQRQEAAMLRKDEKRRAEKEKIMNESDPEKQKRLEEKEIKREKRKNLSKMKQVKIKSM